MSDGVNAQVAQETQETREPDVIVVGAGPVGLWLAAELRLGGATVTVLEKRAQRAPHSRAHTVHARTLEIFASRGIVGSWLDEGIEIPTSHYAMLSSRLDMTGLRSDFPFVLFIPQVRTEELLEQHALDLGVRVVRGVEVTEIEPAGDGVRATAVDRRANGGAANGGAANGSAANDGAANDGAANDGAGGGDGPTIEFTGRFLVGCDGRRSVVRAASGIGYTGTGDTLTTVIGDVCLDDDAPPAITLHSAGGSFYGVRIDSTRHRLVCLEHATMTTPREVPLGLEEFRDTIERVAGRDFGMRSPTWLTRVGSATFQADHYRQGRELLAGDAAHVHFPMGGQGLNLGVADAMNLGWKLAAVLRSAAPDALLDSYEQERAPVGRAVIDDTLAQTAIIAVSGREGQALRGMMTDALAQNAALNAKFAAFASGTEVAYPPDGPAHPLVGRRVPNLRLHGGPDRDPGGASAGATLAAGATGAAGAAPATGATGAAGAAPATGATGAAGATLAAGAAGATLAAEMAPAAAATPAGAAPAGAAPDVFGLLRRAQFGVVGVSPDALASHLRPGALAGLSLAPGGFAGATAPWDQVGAALIRPDGHLAWAADQDSGADVAAQAAAALLGWLPGLGR